MGIDDSPELALWDRANTDRLTCLLRHHVTGLEQRSGRLSGVRGARPGGRRPIAGSSRPVTVDVNIDYRRRTQMTKGVGEAEPEPRFDDRKDPIRRPRSETAFVWLNMPGAPIPKIEAASGIGAGMGTTPRRRPASER